MGRNKMQFPAVICGHFANSHFCNKSIELQLVLLYCVAAREALVGSTVVAYWMLVVDRFVSRDR